MLAIVAIPFFSMRLGSSDAGTDAAGSTTRQAYDLLAKGFGPGYNGPLQLVAQVDNPPRTPPLPPSLVHTQDDRVLRRVQIQANDIDELLLEPRIV